MNTTHAIWTRAGLRRQVQRPRRDGKVETAFAVPGLATAWQALRLEQFLQAVPGVQRSDVDTASRRIRITWDPAHADLPRLLRACDAAGCPAQPLHREALDDAERREADDALKRLLVAGIFAMQAMMFALVLYLDVIDDVDATTIQLFRWLGLLAATPVVGYAAVPFFRHAAADLRARRPGIDVPVALAVILIYAASMWATLRGHGETWFDSVSMLVFVLLLGRYLELRARHRHQALGRAGDHATPLTASRRQRGGHLETVAVAELEPGDRIHVAEGTVVPVDGLLDSNEARLDTSLHTGESRPRTGRRGDAVAAGSVALDGSLELHVTHVGAASSLARLHSLTREARRRQTVAEATGDAAVPWFITGILLLSASTLAFWLWRDPSRAFDATVAVLVVACPCAFALAAPATLTRAMALLARRGVRVTRPRALPALVHVDRAMFDKTGTLTEPAVADAEPVAAGIDHATALAWAVALARESSHPLARALARPHADLAVPAVRDITVVAGHGIRGTIGRRQLQLGRPPAARKTDDGGDALWLSDGSVPLARLRLDETPRPDARDGVAALRGAGIGIELCSGDAPARVAAMAARLGIRHWQARQLPEDKYRRVRQWQDEGHAVLVVGDGNNDAAALAAADVSASLVDATDLARRHADLLLEERLGGLGLARRMALRARRTLWQNRGWGLAWNTLAVPFAAAGLIPPWLAALGMSTSSLIVVLNVLRMNIPQPAATPPRDGAPVNLRERTA